MEPITRLGDTVLEVVVSPDFAHDRTCFAAGLSGLYRSIDGGQTWISTVPAEEVVSVFAVALSPEYGRDQRLYAGLEGGVLRSWDGGHSWAAAVLPVPPPQVLCLAVSPAFAKDSALYAGTAEDGVFRSNDGGVSWTSSNFGLLDRNVLCLVISPQFERDDTIFVGTESGVYMSANGGRAWRGVDFPIEAAPVLDLAISPDFANDGLLYAATDASGLLASDDRGRSWTQVQADLPPSTTGAGSREKGTSQAINAIALSPDFPRDPGILVAAQEGLFISRDRGRSWSDRAPAGGVLTLAAPDGVADRSPLLVGTAESGVRWVD